MKYVRAKIQQALEHLERIKVKISAERQKIKMLIVDTIFHENGANKA